MVSTTAAHKAHHYYTLNHHTVPATGHNKQIMPAVRRSMPLPDNARALALLEGPSSKPVAPSSSDSLLPHPASASSLMAPHRGARQKAVISIFVVSFFYAVNTLGWINCDRFYQLADSEKTPLMVKDVDEQEEMIFVFFEDISPVFNKPSMTSFTIFSLVTFLQGLSLTSHMRDHCLLLSGTLFGE